MDLGGLSRLSGVRGRKREEWDKTFISAWNSESCMSAKSCSLNFHHIVFISVLSTSIGTLNFAICVL
ncbi:uncharacterized protein K460DRAFT_371971, partial [Cucurbitaria berberidis CBS 394.84]